MQDEHGVRTQHEEVQVDGRAVAAAQLGPADGHPVLSFHGTPGSRLSARLAPEVVRELGLRYLTYDRPGYGYSTPHPGRTVADAGRDAEAILDSSDVGTCALMGGSGGAAHALAAAARLGPRVSSVTLVVPTAPIDLMGAEAFYAGMDQQNADLFRAGQDAVETLRAMLRRAFAELPADAGQAEPFRQGVDGILDDVAALQRPWGFALHDVVAPVDIWFGIDDRNAPAAHARWLADVLPHATLHPQDGDHFWPATRLPAILRATAEAGRQHVAPDA